MSLRVFLRPDPATIEANNGIGRVIHAQARYLPEHGIELVGDAARADVIAGHTHDHGAARIDVCHLHGLYWTGDRGSGDYNNWHREANTRIIASARRARVLTVPSAWVALPFERDMRLRPRVIGHGLDFDKWQPGRSQGYVLWNKNRDGDVCNPIWAWELASRGAEVYATFEPKNTSRPAHLRVTGALKEADMRPLIQDAGVYLATTKETFGIGTLEAMASGVPVLGFNWGGTAELVEHQVTGFLVEPGDVDGLMTGLGYLRAHRAELGAAAREAASRYTWPAIVQRYAELYRELADNPEPAGVAVVITCHNYGRYVGACLDSVLAQSYPVDEIVVVDDGSSDDSRAVISRYAGARVKSLWQDNLGVAAARNNGVAATRQPFVVCLDADDLLDPRYVAVCRDALLRDRGQGLTWTGMSILREGRPATGNVWTGNFDWEWQATARIPPATSIPTGAMFRRALWERAGGYEQRYAPGEDAEFYTRGLSVGFTAARATELPLYGYRDHGDGAHKTRAYGAIDEWHPWMRDREYPLGAPSPEAPNIRSYSEPKVSVIIPVGPGHAPLLPEALESLIGQNMREWEVIVVNDSGADLPLARFPFARVIDIGTAHGPGEARNEGLDWARAPLVLFLDADDQLAPGALATLCRAYAAADGRYVYGDWQPLGTREPVAEADYDPAAWLDFDHLGRKHAVSVLMATGDARRLRFDPELPAWEDWDFFARAALEGVHGRHVEAVTLYVRRSETGRTARAFHRPGSIIELLRSRYGGKPIMPCGSCGGNARAVLAARDAWNGTPAEKASGLSVQRAVGGRANLPAPADLNSVVPVRMEFVGARTGSVTYHGQRGAGRFYRGGRNPTGRFANVHPADAAELESTGDWQRVAPALSEPFAAAAPAPASMTADIPVAAPAVTVAAPAEKVSLANLTTGEAAAPLVQPVETAEGVVKRKRKAGGKPAAQSALRDLPPLDSEP